MSETILVPHCRLPANVRMAFTTRDGGVSPPPWDSLNLGLHVGDRQDRVTANRRRVREWLELPAEPVWLIACLGPAIGPRHFEVGPEVRSAFIARAEDADHRLEIEACFASSARSGYFRADLYDLAGVELQRLGVGQVCGGDYCTYGDRTRFFSHRRDGVTGRMASLAWLVAQ